MVDPLAPKAVKALDEVCKAYPDIDREWLQSLARSVIHADAKPLAKITQERKKAFEKFKRLRDTIDKLSAEAANFGQVELQSLALQRSNAALTIEQRLSELRAIFDECASGLAGHGGRTAERRSILIRQVAKYLVSRGIVASAAKNGPLVTISFTILKLAGDVMKNSVDTVDQVLKKAEG
jgi:hypothetical protein